MKIIIEDKEYVALGSSAISKDAMMKMINQVFEMSAANEIQQNPSQKAEIEAGMKVISEQFIKPYFESGDFYNDATDVLAGALNFPREAHHSF